MELVYAFAIVITKATYGKKMLAAISCVLSTLVNIRKHFEKVAC